jgi:hypothetical protein
MGSGLRPSKIVNFLLKRLMQVGSGLCPSKLVNFLLKRLTEVGVDCVHQK